MKLCSINIKELEDKLLTRYAENQTDELLEDLSDYVINSQKEIKKLKNELYKYEVQNSKLQRALVEERVNNGKNIITGEYIK